MNNWTTNTINDSKLVLHTGGSNVSDAKLRELTVPAPEGKHHPTDFFHFYQCTRQALVNRGFELTQAFHALSHENQRYFGLMGVQSIAPHEGEHSVFGEGTIVQHVVGLRASWDKTFSNQLVMGTRVFVCDNLAFSGQIMLRRKNTANAANQLPELCNRAIDVIRQGQINEEQRFQAYRDQPISDDKAAASLVRCAEAGAFGGSAILPIMQEFREPSHDEHVANGHTIYTLQQAITERMKTYALSSVPDRTLRCQRELDRRAGFEPILSGVIDLD